MSKTTVNSLITKMKKAGIVTKVSPWMHEQNEEARYVGLRFPEWADIVSPDNNFLAKFTTVDKTSYVIIFFANKPPFVFLTKKPVTKDTK